MAEIDDEYARLAPLLRRVEQQVKYSGLPVDTRAALMTMAAARLMATAGAMMCAVIDHKEGRAKDDSPQNIAKWTKLAADEVARIIQVKTLN